MKRNDRKLSSFLLSMYVTIMCLSPQLEIVGLDRGCRENVGAGINNIHLHFEHFSKNGQRL